MPEYLSDAIVDLLAELGCAYLPLNPGASFRGLHDSLVNHAGPRGPEPILCTSEGIAVAAAHAYSKATREVAYAAVHDLVGLMQATMGIYNAWCDRTPVVVLGGGGPIDPAHRRPVDWFHSATVQGGLVRDFVKWDDEPATGQASLDAILRAHRLAASEPTGPTYVTLDTAVQEQRAGDLQAGSARDAAPDPPAAAREEDVDRVARTLLSAELPVIVAGRVGLDPVSTPLLVELGETLGAALSDERNLTAIPTTHPLNLSGDPEILAEADVVLGVDIHDLNRLVGRTSRDGQAPLVIDLSQNTLALRSWTNASVGPPADLRLPASPRTGLQQLLRAVRGLGAEQGQSAHAPRAERLRARHDAVVAAQQEALRAEGSGEISSLRLVHELWQAVRNEPWLLTLRNTRTWPEGVWEFDVAGRFLGHSGGGGVGYGPGALLGGALAARDRGELAVGIIGDGDFQYGPGVLWTALHYEIPMLVVVNNNRSYRNDEDHQAHVAKVRRRPADNAHVAIRMDRPTVDFAQVARAHGAQGFGPVRAREDLAPVLRTAVEQTKRGGIAVVDVHST